MGYARNLEVESGQEVWRLATDRVKEFAVDRGANLQLPQPSDYARLPWLNPVKARLNLREYRAAAGIRCRNASSSFPLQVQPESSADVMGQEWRDQAYTARVLADALAPSTSAWPSRSTRTSCGAATPTTGRSSTPTPTSRRSTRSPTRGS